MSSNRKASSYLLRSGVKCVLCSQFRSLARLVHPDKAQFEDSGKAFVRLREALEILCEPASQKATVSKLRPRHGRSRPVVPQAPRTREQDLNNQWWTGVIGRSPRFHAWADQVEQEIVAEARQYTHKRKRSGPDEAESRRTRALHAQLLEQ